MDRLTEAEDLTKKMEAQLKDVEGKPADSLRKATRAMQDSIKNIRESISGKQFERQGYGQVPQVTVTNQLQTARSYIGAKTLTPGPQEEFLVKRAEEMTDGAVSRINGFFDGPWKKYRELAESTRVNLFKDYPPIK
jgi:type IV secretory pathway VirB4 component